MSTPVEKVENYEVVFNGITGAYRLTQQRDLHIGRSRKDFVPGNPEPTEMFDVLGPERLLEMVKAGELVCLTSSELLIFNANCRQFELKSTGKNSIAGYVTSVVYDLDHSVLTRKFVNRTPQGITTLSSSVDELGSFETDGNTFFYPMSGRLEVYSTAGDLVESQSIKIASGGVKINRPIPESRFSLARLPTESVWDTDLKLRTTDVPQNLDLTKAIGELPEASLSHQNAVDGQSQSRSEPTVVRGRGWVAQWPVAIASTLLVVILIVVALLRGGRRREHS